MSQTCPHCMSEINDRATVCPNCQAKYRSNFDMDPEGAGKGVGILLLITGGLWWLFSGLNDWSWGLLGAAIAFSAISVYVIKLNMKKSWYR